MPWVAWVASHDWTLLRKGDVVLPFATSTEWAEPGVCHHGVGEYLMLVYGFDNINERIYLLRRGVVRAGFRGHELLKVRGAVLAAQRKRGG